jgi:hypothetical protein
VRQREQIDNCISSAQEPADGKRRGILTGPLRLCYDAVGWPPLRDLSDPLKPEASVPSLIFLRTEYVRDCGPGELGLQMASAGAGSSRVPQNSKSRLGGYLTSFHAGSRDTAVGAVFTAFL